MAVPKSSAFTLLEMITTVSIMAILVSLGIPAFQEYARKQAMSAAVHALHSDLLMGRSHAIHQDMQVVGCPGSPGQGCTGVNDWSEGWIIFGDDNEDRNLQDDENILRHGQSVPDLLILSSASRTSIRFYPNGSAPGSNGSISFCDSGGPEKARKLVISNLGRIRRDSATTISDAQCP